MNDPSWIQTFTGRKVYPLNLQPEDVTIEDIAHALSMQCRFSGHVKAFYSVAQHSVLVSNFSKASDALWGLLHDASEAYLIDVPRPLKHHPSFAFYRDAERRAMAAITTRFSLPLEAPLHHEWTVKATPYSGRVVADNPTAAKYDFINQFERLAPASR